MYQLLEILFGLSKTSETFTLIHLICRAGLVYIIGIILIRLQSQFMGINTSFNFILNIILGSILAGAIIGEVSYFPTLAMILVIGTVNWLLSLACFYYPQVERIVKGGPDLLVHKGKINWDNMRRNLITKDELMEAVRKNTQGETIDRIKKAYFESDGNITIIMDEKNKK